MGAETLERSDGVASIYFDESNTGTVSAVAVMPSGKRHAVRNETREGALLALDQWIDEYSAGMTGRWGKANA